MHLNSACLEFTRSKAMALKNLRWICAVISQIEQRSLLVMRKKPEWLSVWREIRRVGMPREHFYPDSFHGKWQPQSSTSVNWFQLKNKSDLYNNAEKPSSSSHSWYFMEIPAKNLLHPIERAKKKDHSSHQAQLKDVTKRMVNAWSKAKES